MAEKHSQLLDAFSSIPDRGERLMAIVDRGRRGPSFPSEQKTADRRIPGCVSSVWLSCSFVDNTLALRADAEAPVVNGLVRLLCELYDGAAPADIAANEPTLLQDLDLLRDLSPTRRNGLDAVRSRIRHMAQQYLIAS